MSNSSDFVSDINLDVSRPSTSNTSTSQPISITSAQPTTVKIKKGSPKDNVNRHNKEGTKNVKKEDANVPSSKLTNEFQNLNINSESIEDTQRAKPVSPKRKNAKKKERLERLQIPATRTSRNDGVFSAPVAPVMMPFQDFYPQCRTPTYASATPRYLENMSHHPQFQHMQNIQQIQNIQHMQNIQAMQQNIQGNVHMFSQMSIQHAISVPNTPEAYVHSRTVFANASNSKNFLQNVMQHPLLSKTFTAQPKNSPDNSQRDKRNSPRKKTNGTKKENVEENKFESYMLEKDVLAGLKSSTLIEGVLRINPKQFQHSYVSSSDRSEQDILIDGMRNRNRALEGDVVVVQLIEEQEDNSDNKQKKGKVVYIKEKLHTRKCIGNLKLMADKNRQKALFVPRDHRIPRLNIPCIYWPDNFYQDYKKYEATLFLAFIEDWYDTRFAIGKIVCNIGQSGDMVSETTAILAQNDLDITPYGPEVRHLYPRLDYTIPEEEINIREDCRPLCIFSIDPSNCRDIDDAVSCRELENGNYEIGVHISDVAHFLTENTLLDKKVSEKATTIYLVERAYHMLPDDLCMLCSLFPGQDKLAFSVFWEITKNAEVLSHRLAKTVIHSCCQLSYEHAQAVLEDREDAEKLFPEIYNGISYQDIYKTIKVLGEIGSSFRKTRFDSGALRIDQPKVSFQLNSNGLPESFYLYESKESHQLIEEFMLLANMTVAQKIYEDHPKLAFLRSHPPPSKYMLRQLATSLEPMGIKLDISSAGYLHKSLSQYMNSEDKGKAMVLNMLCAKPMARARYFCAHGCHDEDFLHYALNVPLYTHFTSPIRRYADIMVHRLLAASIKFKDPPTWEVDMVRMIAAQCNKQKYNAKKAGEMSTELYTLKYIQLNSPLVTEAVVVEVREKYIDTIIVNMGLNKRIFFNNDFPGEYKCIKNDAGTKLSKMELSWKIQDKVVKQTIEVFSILNVLLVKGDDNNNVKVETKLIMPK